MISLLLRRRYASTARAILAEIARSTGLHASILPYEHVVWLRALRAGTLIFGDLERLSASECERLAHVWARAEAAGGVRLLNHPTRSLRRYELLRTLHAAGHNRHNVYWVTEKRPPERYPVFIRHGTRHDGPLTPLLHSPKELEDALGAMDRGGVSREDKLIVEVEPVADGQGLYREYAAFRLGSEIIPAHLTLSRHWMSKVARHHLCTPAALDEERVFFRENPHAARLREIFDVAKIEYGRIDYAMKDGAPVVWEINTNPMLMDPALSKTPGGAEVRQELLAGLARGLRLLDTEPARRAIDTRPVAPLVPGPRGPWTKRLALAAVRWLPARCAYVLSSLLECAREG